jgi:enterochelin esterase-like enzyme
MRYRFYYLTLICVLLGASLLSAKSIVAQTPNACSAMNGTVEHHFYHSDLRRKDFSYSIYLPPCYKSSDDPYPVLYLMHGTNEDDKHWLDLGLAILLDKKIQSGKIAPLIAVFPNGSDLAELNSFDDYSWAGVFLNELTPTIEHNYRVSTLAEQRAIGGISRGGFWAYHIALMHPSMFSAVGGHSAVFTPNYVPQKFNPLWLVVTAKDTQKIRFWLDRAAIDVSGPTMNTMAATMKTRKLNLTYKIYKNGNHNNAYWSDHLEDYLEFYTANWH